uniref:Uncharacterized protein n=1 Tax=Rhipicephalus zambeziensis TaxID=60191 RepID=A0A224YEW9_9ACAR
MTLQDLDTTNSTNSNKPSYLQCPYTHACPVLTGMDGNVSMTHKQSPQKIARHTAAMADYPSLRGHEQADPHCLSITLSWTGTY